MLHFDCPASLEVAACNPFTLAKQVLSFGPCIHALVKSCHGQQVEYMRDTHLGRVLRDHRCICLGQLPTTREVLLDIPIGLAVQLDGAHFTSWRLVDSAYACS